MAVALAALAVLVAAAVVLRSGDRAEARSVDLSPYEGLGMWVDVFDFEPAYQGPGQQVPVTVSALDDMAARGVTAVYLQAARDDDTTRGLVDEVLLSAWLERAHDLGIGVVAWFLPKFRSVDADLAKLVEVHEFRSPRGDRFDGLAVDIEETQVVTDVAERNRRLVELSTRLREAVGDDVALGANVLPTVQIEVVNPSFWPDFPWEELAPLYDVWVPMTYWTLRKEEWRDAERYVTETVERMRDRLGDPDAPVHPIGGIADEVTAADVEGYARALAATSALGGSWYDYRTMTPVVWDALANVTAPAATSDATP